MTATLTDNQTMIQTSSGEFCVAQYQTQPNAIPLVLVCGLGMQLIRWPDSLIEKFAEQGYHLIMPDNRDIGKSFKATEAYSLKDVAADYSKILDALGIESAHFVGVSLGGMICQRILHGHPERVKSVTSIMSSPSKDDLPPSSPEVASALMKAPANTERQTVIDHSYQTSLLWSSPAFPTDETEAKFQAGRNFDRSYYPEGVQRQYTAIIGDINHRAKDLAAMTNMPPRFVIHGDKDALIDVAHGRATAELLNCSYLEIAGMGHNLPDQLSGFIVNAITGFISST